MKMNWVDYLLALNIALTCSLIVSMCHLWKTQVDTSNATANTLKATSVAVDAIVRYLEVQAVDPAGLLGCRPPLPKAGK